ncbi:outer membrane lipid asymmetry maintenance protein MlaD [Candidatus Hamiltonella defensa]|uniref:Organic solvent ABC transporter, cytoplasmic membrane protein n=1 Tax=Hamiltonella defensa subsp. Acyrthosiphon pisum (strain 5AT) TaxID=572265 RepID=C4K7J6_HAMD5|nr:outer membrane lipid asymmetry maintenance protein MlaD [Candidatus Hamiltonella defensa]ACQ68539.1 putative organic solvent ABC transporter, cytoplasmic membrane protein [Candidatus Hamiltonella defensa 5AT (Acyrthosiphon pisum)]ATW23079.1 outer membrane lipid asymmetry maintenance protein MlaD [Candidatus Hamiltonella defensa]
MHTKKYEVWVGLLMLSGISAILFLCLKIANIHLITPQSTYEIYANFDNIGGLKMHSPVKIGGVVIGKVSDISLKGPNYTPRVTIDIDSQYHHIPDTSSLAIRTAGLLGEQFLALNLGFEDAEMGTTILKSGDTIKNTSSALVLEDLIGQFLYKSGEKSSIHKTSNMSHH